MKRIAVLFAALLGLGWPGLGQSSEEALVRLLQASDKARKEEDFDQAVEFADQAVKLARGGGDQFQIVVTLRVAGIARQERAVNEMKKKGNYRKAAADFKQASQDFEQSLVGDDGNRNGVEAAIVRNKLHSAEALIFAAGSQSKAQRAAFRSAAAKTCLDLDASEWEGKLRCYINLVAGLERIDVSTDKQIVTDALKLLPNVPVEKEPWLHFILNRFAVQHYMEGYQPRECDEAADRVLAAMRFFDKEKREEFEGVGIEAVAIARQRFRRYKDALEVMRPMLSRSYVGVTGTKLLKGVDLHNLAGEILAEEAQHLLKAEEARGPGLLEQALEYVRRAQAMAKGVTAPGFMERYQYSQQLAVLIRFRLKPLERMTREEIKSLREDLLAARPAPAAAKMALAGLIGVDWFDGRKTDVKVLEDFVTVLKEDWKRNTATMGDDRLQDLALSQKFRVESSLLTTIDIQSNFSLPDVTSRAIDLSLASTGVGTERLRDLYRRARSAASRDPRIRELFQDWRNSSESLDMVLVSRNGMTTQQSSELVALQRREMATRSALIQAIGGEVDSRVSLSAIRERLPKDSALLIIERLLPSDYGKGYDRSGAPVYVGYLVPSALSPQPMKGAALCLKDTSCSASVFETKVALARCLVSEGNPLGGLMDELGEAILKPFAEQIAGLKRIHVIARGKLNGLPVAALRLNGRWLAESVEVAALESGYELVRGTTGSEVVSQPAVLGGFDFAGTGLIPLPGSKIEVQEVANRLKVPVAPNNGSTWTRLQDLVSPKVVHVSTHGFWGSGRAASACGLDGVPKTPVSISLNIEGNNPINDAMAQGGLYFPVGGGKIEVVTGRRLASLNLEGTILTVLAGCDTGVTSDQGAAGAAGLRRAMSISGSLGVLASNWPVKDLVSAKLMKNYYCHLNQGLDTLTAWHQTQLNAMKSKTMSSPRNWASFEFFGRPAVVPMAGPAPKDCPLEE